MATEGMPPELPGLEPRFLELIAGEVGGRPAQVAAAAALFADGASVPFVARYRKEATGALDDAQLEVVAKRRTYFLELTERRAAIRASLKEQDQLTPELEQALAEVATKQALEDLYLPFRPKRNTRAQMARERGLERLTELLLLAAGSASLPDRLAQPFVAPDRGVGDPAEALAGARDVLAERVAEAAVNRDRLRRSMEADAVLRVKVLAGKEAEAAEYRAYFDHAEPARAIPSHRLLAIQRGVKEGFLSAALEVDDPREARAVAASLGVPLNTPCGAEVATAVADGYVRLLRPSIANEVMAALRERAEAEAVRVFRENLEALLLQSPLGQVTVLGFDPGYRTGCKLAVVDPTGTVLATATVHPLPPRGDEAAATTTVVELVRSHGVRAVAVGNGAGGREAEVFLRRVLGEAELGDVVVAIVPETGASVYSASRLAREELADLDVAERGAVSIARRLQDPLAELVKVEPRSLGVGQYQHDVNQKTLAAELKAAVEAVVNRVGVEVNSASPALLRHVSGFTSRLARAVVSHRSEHGPFPSRTALSAVAGLGPRTFEMAAGFLRVRGAVNPLDNTAVHPERYPVVEAMAASLGVGVGELVGNSDLVRRVRFEEFADQGSGLGRFTLADIRDELLRPGRDPRPEYRAPRWRHDVVKPEDLQGGMTLEGRVSNVTNFGAFVDIGVKRDGLVHLSELSRRFVKDPREAVKVGDVVAVKVLGVDPDTGRISLSMKQLEPMPAPEPRPRREEGPRRGERAGGDDRRQRDDRRPAGDRPRRGDRRGRDERPAQPRTAPPPPRRAEARPATVDDLLKKFGGKRVS